MKKIVKLSLVAFLATGTFAYADATKRYAQGYTYYKVVWQSVDYTSHTSTDDGRAYDTSSSVDNPVYVIGGLYNLTNTWDISTEVSTTLVPTRSTEDGTAKDGTTSTSFKNNLEVLNNTITGYAHYKFSNEHRVIGGLTYNLSSWKRYNFTLPSVQGQVILQRSMAINMEAGYWYEGYFMPEDKLHVNFKAIAGIPIWEKTENTSEDVTFSNRSGYNFDIAVNTGYLVYNDAEIGATLGYNYTKKDSAHSSGVYVPEDTFETFYFGVYAAF